jgi:hypothetical protein
MWVREMEYLDDQRMEIEGTGEVVEEYLGRATDLGYEPP